VKAISVGGSDQQLKAGPHNDSEFLNLKADVFVRENNKSID
jgi:hypothetical protein